METVGLRERQSVIDAVATTFSHLTEILEAPVHIAIIPAAGRQHRLFAQHVMQRLLLCAIREAIESGIGHIVLILAPGMGESLYAPLKAALELAIVPAVTLLYCEQAHPEGLGDALLQAEALIDKGVFAVLLPDDIIREHTSPHARELSRMMKAFSQLDSPYLMAVTRVSKSRMTHHGIVETALSEVMPRVSPIVQLVEKPDPADPICSSTHALGIVGRYLLHSDIFNPLRELRTRGKRPVHLTDALAYLCQVGHGIYGFELEATRHDVGEVLEQAEELIGKT